MKRTEHGFTIPEILVILVVLAILALVLSPMWFGAIQTSRDKARETDIRNWAAVFENYKGRFGTFPGLPASDSSPTYACLGTFADYNSKCAAYTSSTIGKFLATDASSPTPGILTAVAKVGAVPTNASPAAGGVYVGPFVWITTQTDVPTTGSTTVTAKFVGFFEGNCSTFGLSSITNGSSGDTNINTLTSDLPNNFKICYLQKQTVNNVN